MNVTSALIRVIKGRAACNRELNLCDDSSKTGIWTDFSLPIFFYSTEENSVATSELGVEPPVLLGD